jgi:16S rRNA (cytosine967-C5)-methyltransferase
MDRVLVDAPCSGSGTWRRRPDAKWRLTAAAVERRLAEQRQILAEAARFVRPGGRLVYVTCSVLPEENEAQVAAFLSSTPLFAAVGAETAWNEVIGPQPPRPRSGDGFPVTMTPATTVTDGFFVALLERTG